MRVLRYIRYLHLQSITSPSPESVRKNGAPCVLRLVGTNDGQQAITLEERACGLVCEKVGTAADMIVHEAFRALLLPKVLYRIRPEDVAHETRCRWFTEAVELKEDCVRCRI